MPRHYLFTAIRERPSDPFTGGPSLQAVTPALADLSRRIVEENRAANLASQAPLGIPTWQDMLRMLKDVAIPDFTDPLDVALTLGTIYVPAFRAARAASIGARGVGAARAAGALERGALARAAADVPAAAEAQAGALTAARAAADPTDIALSATGHPGGGVVESLGEALRLARASKVPSPRLQPPDSVRLLAEGFKPTLRPIETGRFAALREAIRPENIRAELARPITIFGRSTRIPRGALAAVALATYGPGLFTGDREAPSVEGLTPESPSPTTQPDNLVPITPRPDTTVEHPEVTRERRGPNLTQRRLGALIRAINRFPALPGEAAYDIFQDILSQREARRQERLEQALREEALAQDEQARLQSMAQDAIAFLAQKAESGAQAPGVGALASGLESAIPGLELGGIVSALFPENRGTRLTGLSPLSPLRPSSEQINQLRDLAYAVEDPSSNSDPALTQAALLIQSAPEEMRPILQQVFNFYLAEVERRGLR